MEKLFLFTDGFPYGKGEKPFIIPEIDYLSKEHEITIVSSASKKLQKQKEFISNLPDNVELICCDRVHPLYRLFQIMKMPFTGMGRRELVLIWADIEVGPLMKMLRSGVSMLYYAIAQDRRNQFEKTGIFSSDNCLYYTFWFGRNAMALSLEKSINKNIGFISRIHGYDLYNHRAPFGRQPFQWFKKECCSRILFAAQNSLDYFLETYCEKNKDDFEKCILNRLGVDAPLERQFPIDRHDDGFLIVSCSNLIPLKRVDLIAESLSLIPELPIKWIHFGDGDERNALERKCEELNVECHFHGAVSNDVVKEFYSENRVDLFITTSSTEGGCPVSIMEAMSYGIPIIGTAVGGIQEEIDGNGILLSPDPFPNDVADAIEKICLSDTNSWSKMSQRSYELWADRFDVEKNKLNLVEILRKEAHDTIRQRRNEGTLN